MQVRLHLSLLILTNQCPQQHHLDICGNGYENSVFPVVTTGSSQQKVIYIAGGCGPSPPPYSQVSCPIICSDLMFRLKCYSTHDATFCVLCRSMCIAPNAAGTTSRLTQLHHPSL